MPHSVSLITTIAAGLGLALVLGFLAARLRLPALVGYLLAGVVIGPFTPGFVADAELAAQLAEIGVMLLMFGVGPALLARRPAGGAQDRGARRAGADRRGHGAGHGRWRTGGAGAWAAALVFGLALSVASTVVLLRALESRGVLDSVNGRIAVGWLVVEDLAMVLVLVLLPPLARRAGRRPPAPTARRRSGTTLGVTLLQVGGFVALMLVVGRRVFPVAAVAGARAPARASCSRCAWWRRRWASPSASAALFGVSFALGAFFAGMVMRESEFSHRAAEESLPLRDAFAVLFFVSVGMLFDPRGAGRAAAAGAGRGGDHRGRQVAGGLRAGAAPSATRCTRR